MNPLARKPVFSWKRQPVNDRRPVLRLASGGRRWDVRLIGLMSRSRFLVGHPADDGRLIFVKEGEAFNVSTFDGAVVSAFDSTVLRVVLGEAPGLELSLPVLEQRRRETVRGVRRALITLPCSLRYGTSDNALRAGFTGDLSEQGAQVAIERPLPAGIDTITLSVRIQLYGEPVTVQVKAIIRSSAPDPRPGVEATLLGLQFVEVETTLRLSLSLYVRERLLAEADDVFSTVR
ncbi:MAG: flagellar brake protein [Burkholderiales bacterium]|nr:flagellar brake protein [Burkholderiales bacterium]